MGKTFSLQERVVGSERCFVPNGVIVVVEVVKEGDEGAEILVLHEFVSRGMSGDSIEHVVNVEEEECSLRVGVMREVFFDFK